MSLDRRYRITYRFGNHWKQYFLLPVPHGPKSGYEKGKKRSLWAEIGRSPTHRDYIIITQFVQMPSGRSIDESQFRLRNDYFKFVEVKGRASTKLLTTLKITGILWIVRIRGGTAVP